MERPQVSEKEDEVVADGTSHADQRKISVFETEVEVPSKHHKSPLAIS